MLLTVLCYHLNSELSRSSVTGDLSESVCFKFPARSTREREKRRPVLWTDGRAGGREEQGGRDEDSK